MADYPPKKNAAFTFYVGLVSQANTKIAQVNPTLAAGDVKVAIDDGAPANLATLPVVDADFTKRVKVAMSAGEMNGDNISIIFADAAGAEWCDLVVNIQTVTRQLTDLAYPATSGRSMVVDAAGLVDANAVKLGPTGAGTAQTARDVGASVLLSSGTGTGQLDFTSGVVKANLAQILGTALTETAGQIAAAFKQFFDVASPTGTMKAITNVVTATNLTNPPSWNAAWDAEVQSEVEDALVVHRLDELLNADSDIDGVAPPTVGSVFHELMTKTAGSFTYDQTTDSNEAVRDNMGTAQTGDSFARLGAPAGASVSADILVIDNFVDDLESRLGTPSNLGSGATVAANLVDIEGQTDDIGVAGVGLTAVPWNAAWDAEVQSEVQDALDAIVADSIPADGTRPSIAQAIYMLVQEATERSVSGTTVTIKKVDGSTTLFTMTLNDATTPTSKTRAT